METIKSVVSSKEDLNALIDQLWPGGLTVIKNRAFLGGEFILHAFVYYSKIKGIPLIIEDVFDTLPIYMKHLEIMGVYIDKSDVNVIKVGGIQEYGNILGKIKFENDPNVYQRKIEKKLQEIMSKGRYIHLVLGLERFLTLQNDVHSTYILLSLIRQKLGDPRSINVYLVEPSVLESVNFNPLPMLEDMATSVIELEDDEELIRIKLVKSVFTLLNNKRYIIVSPREILRWWT
ncbi:DUF257 family protein [Thermococcus thioreducens]|uniref:DUF835 domain-containing protein n=1 Tax=Thermococcus thioreducens TaxID=277988 RepID=A0A0Q2UN74_9EURY|nr:DUF257 family protein [Thermococcus thioreducens]ASJ11800.1 hypothetical protein A3L14_02355 [Thermococcus thioreducens]KQH82136.1 hypothetical protein AMR53_07295 [Thermococcus thioreducens]SEW13553.1 protein of unknown function, DUF257 [Thermococcus thioreducens]